MQPRRTRIRFVSQDVELAGLLESPATTVKAFALFAHCFTCGKDIAAASRISRALVARGIAVLRFDFTGLGSSDGDFANTNFSSNVQDLVAAADFLRENYQAPSLLIGHSLGGAAVLQASHQVAECKAVVTIGAPATAEHVTKQFACDIDRIQTDGVADVSLAGRPFTIKRQFLDDVAQYTADHIGQLKRALLVMHSPTDSVVSIHEAEKIYRAAKHPKSFISLDNADHLLTNKMDAEYTASCITAWFERFMKASETIEQTETDVSSGELLVEERNQQFTRAIFSDSHFWLADEPTALGGHNLGPDPYEHLLAALGACTSMTIRMYANRKKLPLEHVSVKLKHSRQHGQDCVHCDDEHSKVEVLSREVVLTGDLSADERARLLEIADRCPVHRTLEGKLVITTEDVTGV